MHVLNVNQTLDPVTGGGTAERTFQLSRYLVRAGLECSVLSTDKGLTPARIKAFEGVDVIALPCRWQRHYVPRISSEALVEIVARADVVHMMNHWSILNSLVHRAVRKLGRPYVVCPAGALPIFGRSRLLKRIYNYLFGEALLHGANYGIAIAQSEFKHFETYGVPRERIKHIPNGIDIDALPPPADAAFRDKHGLGQNPFIIFVGRLNAIKGPDLLLQAFCAVAQRIPDEHLALIGPDGGMLAELKAMVKRQGLDDRVHFLGFLGGDEKYHAYHAANLLAIPSRQEAMSIVVLEAGAMGTPVLLTDQCGFESEKDLPGSHIVETTAEGLEKGLQKLLGSSEQLPARGKKLQQYVLAHFSWETIAQLHIELLNNCIEEGPVR